MRKPNRPMLGKAALKKRPGLNFRPGRFCFDNKKFKNLPKNTVVLLCIM